MRRCCTCKRRKPLTAFHRKGDGYHSSCKVCRTQYNRSYYQKHGDKIRRSNRESDSKRVQHTRAIIDDLKHGPCKDCGRKFNPWQMDFDHRDEEQKEHDISHMIKPMKLSLDRILEEIAKCDLVCACCHRQRTHDRSEVRKSP